jgi:protein TonB
MSRADELFTMLQFAQCQNPPKIISMPQFKYPEEARKAGIEGKVFVRVLIDEDGKPMYAGIVSRIPFYSLLFDDESKRIVMESTYLPGEDKGRKVRVWMTIPVRFTLHEG